MSSNLNNLIEEKIKEFDEKFGEEKPTPKQCGVAYPSQMELWAVQREAFYKAKSFLRQSITEAVEKTLESVELEEIILPNEATLEEQIQADQFNKAVSKFKSKKAKWLK